MRLLKLLFVFVVLGLSLEAAWNPSCVSFLYVNGINTSRIAAAGHVTDLLVPQFKDYLVNKGKIGYCYSIHLSYNASLGFVDDMKESASQLLNQNTALDDYQFHEDLLSTTSVAIQSAYLTSVLTTPKSGMVQVFANTNSVSTPEAILTSLKQSERDTVVALVQNVITELKSNRTVVCIGHSQGNFFCNLAYRIIKEGTAATYIALGITQPDLRSLGISFVDNRVVQVIGVATPADFTADKRNQYVTVCKDAILAVPNALPANSCVINWWTNLWQQSILTLLQNTLAGLLLQGQIAIQNHFLDTYLIAGSATQQTIMGMLEKSIVDASTISLPLLSNDGSIGCYASNWSLARSCTDSNNGNGGRLTTTTATSEGATLWSNGNGWWYIARHFMTFDPTPIPANAIIQNITLSLKGRVYVNGSSIALIKASPQSNTILQSTDFGRITFGRVASDKNTEDFGVNPTMQTWTLNQAGIDYIMSQKALGQGASFAVVALNDFNNANPGSASGNNYGLGDIGTSRGSDKSNLVVTYSISTTTNTKPTITLLGANPLSLTVGSAYVDPGFTANDAEDGTITSKVGSVNTVNTAVAGTYSVTYSVTDSGGLSASAIRTVVVSAPTAPITLSLPLLSNDGSIGCYASNWSLARSCTDSNNGNGGRLTTTTATSEGATLWSNGNGWWYIARHIVSFDTTLLSPATPIMGGTLTFTAYCYVKCGMLSLVKASPQSSTTLQSSDFGRITFERMALDKNSTDFGTSYTAPTTQSWTLNQAGIDYINAQRTLGKSASFAIITQNDFNTTDPGSASGNNYGLSEIVTSRGSVKPTLAVTSSTPPTTPTGNLSGSCNTNSSKVPVTVYTNTTVFYDAFSTGGTATTTYAWTGANSSSTPSSATAIFASPGVSTASVRITNSLGQTVSTNCPQVTVIAPPVLTASITSMSCSVNPLPIMGLTNCTVSGQNFVPSTAQVAFFGPGCDANNDCSVVPGEIIVPSYTATTITVMKVMQTSGVFTLKVRNTASQPWVTAPQTLTVTAPSYSQDPLRLNESSGWQLSSWTYMGPHWYVQPIITYSGVDHRYAKPSDYILALQQLKNWGYGGSLDLCISQFQNAQALANWY